MQSEHRKIELQSPQDLTYLTSQIRTAARQKLDLHLPAQTSDTPDDLRAQTEVLVDAFVAQVLAGLKSNITINGLDVIAQARGGGFGGEGADAMEIDTEAGVGVEGVEKEEFEAFDEKLRSRLADQVARRDKLVASISKHRRETPAAAARRWEEQFEREAEAMEAQKVKSLESAATVEEGLLDVGLKREEEVRRNWEKAVEGLGRLNKGLPETRARLERCGDVVGYLDGKRNE
jgi:kinetochor protein Mis14/NSL1